jgi:hypothetical protein
MRRLAVVSSTLFALLFPCGAQAWSWPVDGPVLRPFVFGSDPYAAGQHRGIDVGGAVGESVRAPIAGTVSFAGSVPAGGRALTIRTGDGYSVTLLQLGSIAVQRGDEVVEGARVGAVGESSDAVTREPHVHLGVRRTADEEGYLDPLAFLPSRPRVVPAPAPAEAPPPVQPQPAPPPPRVEQPAPPPAPSASQPATQATPAAPTWSEEPAVEAPEPVGEPGELEVVASARPLAASDGLIVRAGRARPLPRAENTTMPAPKSSLTAPAREALRAADAKSSPRALAGPSSDLAARDPAVAGAALEPKLVANTGPGAAVPRPLAWAAALAVLMLIAGALARTGVIRKQARIMASDERLDAAEDLGRSGVAVCVGPAAHRPRGRVRRAVGCVRAVPPTPRQRRADGQRHRRARHAGDGGGRSGWRVSA